MTMRIRNNTSVLLLLMAMICLSACSHSGEPDNTENPWDGSLTLVLDVGVVEPGSFPTRALSSTRDIDGTNSYYENPTLAEEKMQSLRVIIVDPKKDEIIHNELESFVNSPGLRISGLRFQIDFETDYKVFLIANEVGLPDAVVNLLEDPKAEGDKTLVDVLSAIQLSGMAGGPVLIDNYENDPHKPIPMSEIYDVSAVAFPNTNLETVKVELKKSFFVTRAASKFSFRFLKKEGYVEEDNNLEIKSIKVFGLGDKEFLFPTSTVYNPAKDTESAASGREITKFGVPSDAAAEEFIFDLGEFPIKIKDVTATIHPLYSPLYYFGESLGDANRKLFCSISYDGVNYLPAQELPNLPYALPRNTHVIVQVTLGNDGALLYEVEVLPWVPQYHEIDFTDNIAMADDGTLTFAEGTYASLDKATGRLVLNDYPQAVTGTFGISEPINCRWYAYLVTTSGEQNAIQFQVTGADGKTTTSSYISGIIDGQLHDFKVVATQSAGQETRSAVLQVMVTMADGLTVPINILKSTEYGTNVEHITFIQNRQ